MAHFCDEDRLSGEAGSSSKEVTPRPLTTSALAREYVVWLLVLSILVVLCFTPMVLVAGLFYRVLP